MTTSFIVNAADLAKILDQIKIAERHAAGENLIDIIGQDNALLPVGLRTVDGSFNHLLPGQEQVGAADGIFPRLLTPEFINDADGDRITLVPGSVPGAPPGGVVITNTNYDPTAPTPPGAPPTHSVVDADPRIISNLISDQTLNNKAALAAALLLAGADNPSGTADIIMTARADAQAGVAGADVLLAQLIADNGLNISADGSIAIEHRSPDIGLSPANNGWMTLFGQFFDHGLDLVTKGGNGTIYIPLQADDPLYDLGRDGVVSADDGFGADGVFGNADDKPNFMALTRTTPFNGTEAQNTTTPFVDQNQTYTSHASHQVFLREYVLDAAGDPIATGKLLNGVNGGIANWGEVKAQAASMLGIALSDYDVHDVPLLRTDPYGKFIPGANGFAQIITGAGVDGVLNTADDIVVEGNPLAPVSPGAIGAQRTGHAFLNDIAHHATPTFIDHDGNPATPRIAQIADTDPGVGDDGNPLTYDDEMLNAHFITGDGRGNENIGLTAVHTIFHSEHNRLVDANKATIIATGDLNFINEWLTTDLTALPAPGAVLNWDGERLFQSARFVTEMQYQHLVFEEFARRVQPNVDPFVFTNSADLDPAIVAEFAHAVYRFGHSQLADTVDRLNGDLELVDADPDQLGLIEAFLNPQAFTASGGTLSSTSDEVAAGAIVRGMSRQVGNEIDEFVVEAVRNNLLGLPLDLPALNIARGRETGIATLNHARAELYERTGDVDVKPYTSWLDFAQNIKNPLSVVNFIAAYGKHAAITSATTLEEKRDAALLLVLGDGAANDVGGVEHVVIRGVDYTDRKDFLNSTGAYTAETSGLNSIDLWIGGLAEEIKEFGGMLGSTFNLVFEYQMEHLQNGDRFYYLSRTQGMNLLNLLEPNTFADLIIRNTDLGDLHSTHLSAEILEVPDLFLELDPLTAQENYGSDPLAATNINAPGYDRSLLDPTWDDDFQQSLDPKVVRVLGTVDVDGNGFVDGNILKFSGGEHVVLGGTEGNDRIYGDKGIDTLWGDGGNDYLNPGMESDQVFGGDGDDIIEDPFGDDFLRGEAGDDVIVNGHGLDLLFGGEGQDFIQAVTDTTEVFAGPGNDFVLGGSAPDGLLGNEGDDWIEGGEGFDSLSGENSELFFNSRIVGHDILNGQGNDTDYDGENGDDIMVQSAGIQRNNGMDGFDWAIHKGDNVAADSDLGIRVFDTRPALILRDRFDSVEGLSGWKFDDKLTGAARLLAGEGFDKTLTQAGVDRIAGLNNVISAVAAPNPTNDPNAIILDQARADAGGEIILGGAGSDIITGNLGDDIIDGDAWLNVRIAVHATKDATGPTGPVLFSVDSLTSVVTGAAGHPEWNGKQLDFLMRTGAINPGQLQAVREILYDDATNGSNPADASVDVAVFSDVRANYTIVRANGIATVTHTPPGGVVDDGVDTLRNIEFARFTDQDVFIGNRPATGRPTITGAQNVLAANISGITDPDGVPAAAAFTFLWQRSADGLGGWTDAAAGPTFTVPPGDLNFYRVVASFLDNAGFTESATSVMTARVGSDVNIVTETLNGTLDPNLLNGRGGPDTINGLGGNDVINGGGGTDTLNGGDGNDILDGGAGNDVLTGGAGDDTIDGAGGGGDVAVFSGTPSDATFALNAAGGLVVTGPDGIDTLTAVEQLQFGAATFNLVLGTNANNAGLAGTNGADIVLGFAGNDTITAGLGNDYVDAGAGNDTIRWGVTNPNGGNPNGVSDGRDIITGGANTAAGDTFVINGNNQAETYRVYARAAALAAGITGLAANTDIVITRNGTNNASVIAELDEIEEILINTGPGNDTVLAIGNFNPTNLNFNTIAVVDGGGSDTVDVTQLTSDHHVAFHTLGSDDVLIGARPQDEIIAGSGGTGGGDDDGDDDDDDDAGTGGGDDDGDDDDDDAGTGGGDDDGDDDDDDAGTGGGDDDGDDDDDDAGTGGGDDDDMCNNDDGNQSPNPPSTGGTGGNISPFVIYFGTSGNDTGVGSAGNDTLTGEDGDDTLFGLDGDDNLAGGAGADQLFGGAGKDILVGNDGNDTIFAGTGDDTVLAGRGADVIFGDDGDDLIFGNEGRDQIDAGAGNDTIFASLNDGDDAVNGGAGNDTLDLQAITADMTIDLGLAGVGYSQSSQSGYDTLGSIENVKGGAGDDTIYASNAANIINGGAGDDTIVFRSVDSTVGDRVEGFEPGDKIDLRPIYNSLDLDGDGFDLIASGVTFTEAGQLRLRIDGQDSLIEGNTDDQADIDFSIRIAGRTNLTGNDFA